MILKWHYLIVRVALFILWEEWPSGLRRCDQNRKVPGSNPTRRSAGTQPRYEAPGDPRVEYVKCKRLTLGE